MWKSLRLLAFLLLALTAASATDIWSIAEIPLNAQLAVQRDYLEWMHLPRWAGDCAEMLVVGITWIRPEAVDGQRPVLWLKERATGRYAAILGLNKGQLDSIRMTIAAEPVHVLPDVSIYRLCRPWTAGY